VLGDHLADAGPVDERRANRRDLEGQRALAVGPQAEAIRVLLVQAQLVERVVGLLGIER